MLKILDPGVTLSNNFQTEKLLSFSELTSKNTHSYKFSANSEVGGGVATLIK